MHTIPKQWPFPPQPIAGRWGDDQRAALDSRKAQHSESRAKRGGRPELAMSAAAIEREP